MPIVDDEPADLQLLAKDLELVSYEVLTAIDGPEALLVLYAPTTAAGTHPGKLDQALSTPGMVF